MEGAALPLVPHSAYASGRDIFHFPVSKTRIMSEKHRVVSKIDRFKSKFENLVIGT